MNLSQPESRTPVICVDGPSGAGKGTLCARLAQRFGWHLLDSGAIYRALAFALKKAHAEQANEDDIINIINLMRLSFKVKNDSVSVVLDEQDISAEIRTETVGALASQLAVREQVRTALLQRQRDFARPPGLIADGRDMGSVVFPQARLKIFLNATAEERAQRRYKQLKAKGYDGTLARLFREIVARDKRDAQRSVAPLIAAEDAHQIDTTQMSADEVFELALSLSARVFGPAI